MHSLVAVWQVEVHNGIKDKAQLSALALVWISLGWQKLVNVGISDAVHFLHATPHCCWCKLLPNVVGVTCTLASPGIKMYTCLSGDGERRIGDVETRSERMHNNTQDAWSWLDQMYCLTVETDVEYILKSCMVQICFYVSKQHDCRGDLCSIQALEGLAEQQGSLV